MHTNILHYMESPNLKYIFYSGDGSTTGLESSDGGSVTYTQIKNDNNINLEDVTFVAVACESGEPPFFTEITKNKHAKLFIAGLTTLGEYPADILITNLFNNYIFNQAYTLNSLANGISNIKNSLAYKNAVTAQKKQFPGTYYTETLGIGSNGTYQLTPVYPNILNNVTVKEINSIYYFNISWNKNSFQNNASLLPEYALLRYQWNFSTWPGVTYFINKKLLSPQSQEISYQVSTKEDPNANMLQDTYTIMLSNDISGVYSQSFKLGKKLSDGSFVINYQPTKMLA
ncbi:MAG: hypothetical protein GY756_22690 [bacterium]|nr:hypothetical protein [bacterium]